MNKNELLTRLGLTDPFDGFVPDPTSKLWGWNGDFVIFQGLVLEKRPTQIVEIGSWMGQSSCSLATGIRRMGLESTTSLVCVDTWLGSLEHWTDPTLRAHLELKHGFPSFYYKFLSNVANLDGLKDVVVPVPLPSSIAAKLLKEKGITADLIYVDGSHDEEDVFVDLKNYWELLEPGGVVFGDDFGWSSVSSAVKRFSAETSVPYVVHSEVFWLLRKRS